MKERINQDYLKAFKAQDMERKNFLGLIKGEIQTEEKRGNNVDVDAILRKMEKSLKTTNDVEAQKQLEILKEYLPEMMGEVEIRRVLLEYKNNLGATKIPDFMSNFNREYKGKADNQLVMQIIKELI